MYSGVHVVYYIRGSMWYIMAKKARFALFSVIVGVHVGRIYSGDVYIRGAHVELIYSGGPMWV